jgi:hypothetical protein
MSAPVTFHVRVDVPSGLRLALKSVMTAGVFTSWGDADMITGDVTIGWGDAELTVVVAELVTVPVELVALRVYTVDVAGDITMDPEALTRPIPWSILTELAPVTSHDRFVVSPALIADGLLLKVPITEGWAAGAVAAGAGG